MADQESLVQSTYTASAVTWPFTAVTTVLFAMRVSTRLWRLHKNAIGWDDLVISLSWVFDIVSAASYQKALDSTRGISADNIASTVPKAAFWVVFTDAWAFLSIALPKLGVGILLIRIFRPQHSLKILILGLSVALNILALAGFIITFLQCNPVEGQWNPFQYPQTKCWNRNIQIIYACTVSGISAFMDIAFAVYPGVIVWSLQMPTWKKLCTMALMGLGLGSFGLAVVKLISNTTLLGDPDINTLLFYGIQIGKWNRLENDFVLSAACLPCLPSFLRACGQVLKTHITSPSQPTYSNSFTPLKSPKRPSKHDNNQAVELAPNGELPGTWDTLRSRRDDGSA